MIADESTKLAEQRFRDARFRRKAWIIYIGWLVAMGAGYFAILVHAILFVMALSNVKKTAGTIFEAHFKNYVLVFVVTLIPSAAALVLSQFPIDSIPTPLFTAFVVLAGAIAVWALYRIVKGMLRLSDGRTLA